MVYLDAVPAYGRDYKSKKEVQEAWNEGKDFQIKAFGLPEDESYINKDDVFTQSITLNIRYNQLRGVHVVKVK